MTAELWVSAVKRLIDELYRVELGYPLGTNAIFEPQSRTIVDGTLRSVGLDSVASMTEFYSCCDGISLPDVHVGYFLKSLSQLANARTKSEPTHIAGQLGGNVRTFGSTGGGGLFVIRKAEWDILYLPPGPLRDGVYDNTRPRARILAPSFSVFLDLVLADIAAFVKGIPSHRFAAAPDS
jgi:hypothetical protein